MPEPGATSQPEGYDSPWKEALERYFEPFMALLFPEAHAQIDWSRGYEFLDKELQQVVRDAELRSREVDKLVKVWKRDGAEAWVLCHIEIQAQRDPEYEERIYIYNYRLYDRYRRQVASLSVLCDPQRDWRPDRFYYELFGCEVSLRFPAVKLLDWEARWEELEQSPNPFAVVVMAHLKTQATHRAPESRLEWKLRLTRGLYERGFSPEDVLELFRVLDWMMALPEDLEERFDTELEEYETERKMPYVTHIERRGIRKGTLLGLRRAVLQLLEARLGEVPPTIREKVEGVEDEDRLLTLTTSAGMVESLDEFHRALDETP